MNNKGKEGQKEIEVELLITIAGEHLRFYIPYLGYEAYLIWSEVAFQEKSAKMKVLYIQNDYYTFNFGDFKCMKIGLFHAPLIFAPLFCTKIKGAQKLMGLKVLVGIQKI